MSVIGSGSISPRVSQTDARPRFIPHRLSDRKIARPGQYLLHCLDFSYFRIPTAYQHRVLYWGIVGAVIMRGVMIVAGTALIERVDWILYLFGALLIISGVRMGLVAHPPDLEKNPIITWTKQFFPVLPEFAGERFFVAREGQLFLTPLALALIMIETSDLIFALDSIPAIFSVTRDPFLVFTSNIMALLGLRSLYFALSGLVDRFRYLRISLGVLLVADRDQAAVERCSR